MRFRNDSASDNLPTCEQLIICHGTVSDSDTAVTRTICTSVMCTAHKREQELDEKQSSAHVATDVHNTATGRRSQDPLMIRVMAEFALCNAGCSAAAERDAHVRLLRPRTRTKTAPAAAIPMKHFKVQIVLRTVAGCRQLRGSSRGSNTGTEHHRQSWVKVGTNLNKLLQSVRCCTDWIDEWLIQCSWLRADYPPNCRSSTKCVVHTRLQSFDTLILRSIVGMSIDSCTCTSHHILLTASMWRTNTPLHRLHASLNRGCARHLWCQLQLWTLAREQTLPAWTCQFP